MLKQTTTQRLSKNKESCGEQNGSNVCPSVGDTAKSAEQYWHSRGQNIFPI